MTDAVVIGSGPNGLASAIRLTEAGLAVRVLEASDRPGGAVRSEELTLPGFVHDTFSSVYPAAAASPVFARMPLAEHGLQWSHPRACMAHPLPGGRSAVLHPDLEATRASLDAIAPGAGRRWADWVQPFVEAYPALRDTMLSGFPPVAGPLRMLRDAGPARLGAFAALLAAPATRFARHLFDAPDARAWLYGTALHVDTPPFRPGSAVAAFYLQVLGHAVGWPSPVGGAGRLADALASYLRSLGGEIQTGARVERIEAGAGRVRAVRTADGARYPADLVIADVMPHALLDLAGEALSRWYRAALRRYTYGSSTLKLDWALDGPIPWLSPEVGEAGTVHVGGSEDDLLQSFGEAEHALPERPFLLLGQQTLADPTRAPPGRHTAWAYAHASQDADWSPAGQAQLAARMEAQIERFAPGFGDRVLARHQLGPTDLQARDANLVGGDVGGGSYRLDQLVFRPYPTLNPYSTPLDGLYLGSAATFPGGAVHGVCGDAAARAALRRYGRADSSADGP